MDFRSTYSQMISNASSDFSGSSPRCVTNALPLRPMTCLAPVLVLNLLKALAVSLMLRRCFISSHQMMCEKVAVSQHCMIKSSFCTPHVCIRVCDDYPLISQTKRIRLNPERMHAEPYASQWKSVGISAHRLRISLSKSPSNARFKSSHHYRG